MSLESCIRKAGKNFSPEDRKSIKSLRSDIMVAGNVPLDEANKQAVSEYIEILESERKYIMDQLDAMGAVIADPTLSPSEFVKQMAEKLEQESRKFPRKQAFRPGVDTNLVDYKTGTPLPPAFKGARDPNVMQEVSPFRTERTVEMMWPDFNEMSPQEILYIANQFDPDKALAIAKKFNLVLPQAKSLEKAQWNQKRLAENSTLGTANPDLQQAVSEAIVEWVEANETLPLRYSIPSSAEAEFVDAHPDHPLSATTKWGAVLNKAEKAQPKGVRKLFNDLISKGNMRIEAVLGAVPQTKLPDFIRYGMESVQEYTRTVKRMDAWMNSVIEEHHDLARRWLGFNQKNTKGAKLLGEFMHASTLAGVDVPEFEMPSDTDLKRMSKKKREMWAKRASDYEILKPFWDRLGGMGDKTTYQRQAYDPAKEKIVPVGDPVEVSEGQALYMEVRDTYASQRTMLMQNLEKRVNETEADGKAKAALITKLRKQFESGEITPYFPLSRFGKHQAVAKTPEGEVVAYIHRETRKERNQWADEMRAEGFYVEKFEEGNTDVETLNKIDPQFVSEITAMFEDTEIVIDKESGTTVPGSSAQDAIWQAYLRTLPELSARKAYIHRIGRLGFTHDALRAFSDHSFHSTHQMAKLRYGHELSEHLLNAQEEAEILLQREEEIKNYMAGKRPPGYEDASVHEVLMNTPYGGTPYQKLYAKYKKELGDTGTRYSEKAYIKSRDQLLAEAKNDGPWAVPLSNELQRRHQYNMNPKSAPWSTKLTALGFFWFLSTSPAAGFLNMTQTAISAYPVLRGRFAGAGVSRELFIASKEYATAPTTDKLTVKLTNDKVGDKESETIGDRAAFEEFDRIGMFSKTRTRELMGLGEAGSAYSTSQEQVLEFAGYIFHKTEEMNRVVTGMAAYRLARKKLESDKGLTLQEKHDKAVLEAEELVELSHYDYTNTNRPRFMQGDTARVVFLFRNYSLNMQYRLLRDFRDGIWKNDSIPKEQRREARTRFLGIIGMSTIFAGVAGWPMMWAVEALANATLGDEDEPFDSKTEARKMVFDATSDMLGEVWGERVANSIIKGPWSELTGADLSMRASLNNLWIREIPENTKRNPQELMKHLSGEMLGPIWGIGMNMAAGYSDMQQGHTDRALEKFSPKFVGDIAKTIRYATKGAQTYAGDVILPPDAFTSYDMFLQAAGFMPTELSVRYEQNRAVKDMAEKLRVRRQDITNRLFNAWRIGDRGLAREAMQEIQQWNKTNPRFAITPDSIKQSASSRAQYDMRTIGGVAVDKRLQYMHEQMRFTQRPQR